MGKKFIFLIVLMVAVAAFLMFQAAKTGTSHVYSPSELARMSASGQTISRLRVVGRVSAEKEIFYQTEPHAELRFLMVDPPEPLPVGSVTALSRQIPASPEGASAGGTAEIESAAKGSSAPGVPVVYRGLRPDMFTAGRDVIIDGSFEGGTVIASTLLTQCPSKYEAPSPEKRYGLNDQQVYAPTNGQQGK